MQRLRRRRHSFCENRCGTRRYLQHVPSLRIEATGLLHSGSPGWIRPDRWINNRHTLGNDSLRDRGFGNQTRSCSPCFTRLAVRLRGWQGRRRRWCGWCDSDRYGARQRWGGRGGVARVHCDDGSCGAGDDRADDASADEHGPASPTTGRTTRRLRRVTRRWRWRWHRTNPKGVVTHSQSQSRAFRLAWKIGTAFPLIGSKVLYASARVRNELTVVSATWANMGRVPTAIWASKVLAA